MQPIGDTFAYRFGDAFFVAPIYQDTTEWTVELPEGEWHYLFDLRKSYTGPQTVTAEYPLDESPVFIQAGSVVPMNVKRAYTGFGDTASEGYVTFLIIPGVNNVGTYVDPGNLDLRTWVSVEAGDEIMIVVKGTAVNHLLRVYLPEAPAAVLRDGAPLAQDGWSYDETSAQLVVRSEGADNEVIYRIQRAAG
jgi:hypothetical protein